MSQRLVIPHPSLSLAVEFHSENDRYAHRIVVLNPSPIVLVSSCEGTADENWPPSPVFQEVQACEIGNEQPGLLGVGLAGKSHWSVAIEGHADLVFDVACRVNASPDYLGSTYQVHQPCERGEDAGLMRIDLGGSTMVGWEVLDGEFRIVEDHCAVVPAAMSGPFPATIRWSYRFHLLES